MKKNILPIIIVVLALCLLVSGISFLFSGDTKESSMGGFFSNIYNSITKQNQEEKEVKGSSAKIVNLHSHPLQGENWIISFETEGTADLKIIPNDQDTIDDDEFQTLRCLSAEALAKEETVGEERTPQILDNDVIYYPSWHCDGVGQVIHYTKKAGKHIFRFEFGGQAMYAYNSAAWYHPSWTKRKKITIQNDNVDANLTNFPLYVEISSDISMGSSAQADGDDILFTKDDGITQIPHEEVYFNVSGGSAIAYLWVKVPLISSGATTDIYLYYGNSTASDQSHATEVWDENYKAVWHLSEASGIIYDSTANNHDSTSIVIDGGGAFTYRQASPTGYGVYLNDAYAQFDDSAAWDAEQLTIEFWVDPDEADANRIWPQRTTGSNGQNLICKQYTDGAGNFRYQWDNGPDVATAIDTAGGTVTGGWQYYTATKDADGLIKVYSDGVASAETDIDDFTYDDNGVVRIGDNGALKSLGYISEVRWSNTARVAAWIKFVNANIAEADNELTWTGEESYSIVPYKLFKGDIQFGR
ncbi:MAG: hypothetical protein A2427_03865 [Candidatus Nealsonbacteria bacterium RIFOXYC1_FULL_40_7]|uniref:DUF2341 domain-containing protein n=1 Tax=Candidatus Nealsonbacteria bacterium RIFOXYC1_FULL_40_7 TaxID=1801678 RepID=A0A1G2ER81_9BACT|nr:MAG: hypothetical protein A2427_03865 [Candidatus Nealsonbacteria bacterium RIFOXYC1_FULL_40_7]OGZ29245.1 MAG: hypothetical protein A2562_04300 [Candidatus Nealsonbacteria bacterium RIFOXYD1_FULL_39_11]